MSRTPRYCKWLRKEITNTSTRRTLQRGKHNQRMNVLRGQFGVAKEMRTFVDDEWFCPADQRPAAHLARRLPHLKTAKNRRRFLSHLRNFDLV